MARPFAVRLLFTLRIILVVAASLFALFALIQYRSAQSALGQLPTTRFAMAPTDFVEPATRRLAMRVDDLYTKVAPLEESARRAQILTQLFERSSLIYLGLFTPLAAALLQAAERYFEDRGR
jgi:hypothetical protein